MSEPVIEVRHLSKSFGTHVVLRDVDFTVNPGDVTCIIGASGSGKSTLLRCINLLETPTNGKVLFHGNDITAKGSDPCAYRAKVGMVFQSFNLFNNMTVLDNCTAGLRYVLHMDKEAAERTALDNLEKVGMAPYIHAKPRYQEAKRYFDAHGDLNVPAEYVSPNGYNLGNWVKRQRYTRYNPEKSCAVLTEERIAKLDEIGMRWEKADSRPRRLELAQEPHRESEKLNVSANHKTGEDIGLCS